MDVLGRHSQRKPNQWSKEMTEQCNEVLNEISNPVRALECAQETTKNALNRARTIENMVLLDHGIQMLLRDIESEASDIDRAVHEALNVLKSNDSFAALNLVSCFHGILESIQTINELVEDLESYVLVEDLEGYIDNVIWRRQQ